MSRQAIQDSVDVSVDAVADLSTLINDVRVANGTRVWVTGAGATHGLWCLDQTSALAVDGLTVVATLSGVGRWIFFGASGGAAAGANISVNTEALLSAVGVSALKDGAIAYVGNPLGGAGQSQGSTWQLVTQIGGAPALLAHEVIASAAAGRVWARQLEVVNPRWIQQATYQIDPALGNDENEGTLLNPLQSYAEYVRRCPYIYLTQTVTIRGTLPDSDNLVHSPEIRWHQSIAATMPALVIVGVPTIGVNHVVVSSSDELANAAPLVDAGFAIAIGTIIQATSGASIDATAVVLANVAGTNFRTSPWRSSAGLRVAPPAPADTIATLTLPIVNAVDVAIHGPSFSGSIGPQISLLDIKLMQPTNPAIYRTCSFGGAQVIGAQLPVEIVFEGCSFTTTGACGSAINGSSMVYKQCGFVGIPGRFSWAEGAYVQAIDCVLQNFTIDFGSTLGGAAKGMFRSVGVFYTVNGTGVLVARGSYLHIDGTLYGPNPGGASTGTSVRNGGQIDVANAVTPTLAGATELILDGAGTAMPNLLPSAGGALPNAAALTTWAQWVAAPFNRNVMAFKSPARINDF